MAKSDDDDDLSQSDVILADLIDAVMKKHQAGEPVDLAEVAASRPEYLDDLEELLPILDILDDPAWSEPVEIEEEDAAECLRDDWRGQQPRLMGRRLGDFRILREIGRGGMGIVYEARQISLPRPVALKALPFATVLDVKHLQRFKNEAGAAASLDHPNIVTIYSVGCERGVHYYAMQYIEGQTLAAVIDQLQKLSGLKWGEATLFDPPMQPTGSFVRGEFLAEQGSRNGEEEEERRQADPASGRNGHRHPADSHPSSAADSSSADSSLGNREFFRAVAKLGIQAADALEHAHQMGIVHRDVKPSNLMVDASGHLWVTDFGLAMSPTDTKLTGTGDLVGTLRYMSPEQVEGTRHVLDHRTDIYSLGVTLYELLALRPAVTSSDRHEVIHQITESDPRPLRRANRSIPRDLETIVQKAVAKEPRSRYATARELADDLRRFLADEPIRARRPSTADRVGKWARRHRAILTTGILTLSAAVLIAGLLVWRERNQTLAALVSVSEERNLAERQQKLAEDQKEEALRQRDISDRGMYVANMRLAVHYWTTGRTDGLVELLRAQSPAGERPDLRGWEWYYFFSQCHAQKFTLPFQQQNVLAWSPDGQSLATAGAYGVNLWDAGSRKRKAFLKTRSVSAVAWSPDAKRLAVATDRERVEIWEIASGRLLQRHAGLAFALDWSPDGSRLARGGDDGRIRISDPQTGQTLTTIDLPGKIVWSLDWHPDSRRLLAVVGVAPNVAEQLQIWDTTSGREVAGWPTNGQQASFSPDGRRVAWGSYLASVTDWETGQRVSLFQQHGGQNSAFSPDGKRLASPAHGGPIHIWEADSGKEIRHILALMPDSGRVAWNPAGSLLAAVCDQGVAVWDADASQEARTMSIPDRYALSARFSPDGKRLLVGARYGLMKIYDVESGKTTLTVEQPGLTWLRCVAWRPDGRQFACAWPGDRVAICDPDTGKHLLPPLTPDGNWPRSLAWSPDGTVLAVGVQNRGPGPMAGRGRVVLVSTDTGRQIAVSDYVDWPCNGVAWSGDGKYLAATGKRLRVWDSALKRTEPAPDIPAVCVSWSPDGKQLAVAGGTNPDHGDGTIGIYDTTSWLPLAQLAQSVGDLVCLAWHPRMPRLASGSQRGTIRIWDTRSPQEIVHLETSAETVYHRIEQLDWSPDGLRLASASQDGTVRIWDASRAAPFLQRQDFRMRIDDLIGEKRWQEALDLIHKETRGGLAHFAESSEQNVPVPFSLSEDLELQMLFQQIELARANQLVRDGQLEAATALYRQLSAESPDLPEARLLLANALFYPGNEAKALQWLEELVAESPDNEQYRHELAHRYRQAALRLCRAGRFDEAAPVLAKLAGRFPDGPDFRAPLAAQMAMVNRLNETLALLEKIPGIPPDWPDYRPELARRLLHLSKSPQVAAFYRQMVAGFPDVPEYRRGLGNVCLADGVALFTTRDFQKSLQPLSEAVALLARFVSSESQGPPDYDLTNRLWEAYHRRAGSHLNLGELDGAIADYSEAIRVISDDPMPYCWRAVAYLKLGDIDNARADCEAYLKLPRSCPCTPLAQTLAERLPPGAAPEWALAVARRAVELSPESAEAWKSLGLLHVAAGDRGEAAVAFSKAVELAPGDATLRSLLEENARQTTSEEPAQEMHDG